MRPALATAVLGIALVLVAGTFDAEPLYVPGLAFVLLPLATALWIAVTARGVGVRRELGARRVVEEEPLDVSLQIASGRLPLSTGLVADAFLREPVPLAAGRRSQRVRIVARFARRGRRALPPPAVVLRDPVGLVTRRVDAAEADEVLVLPRTERVRSVGAGDEEGRHRRGRPAIAAEVELDGVRELREGTPASRIYWPALARGAGLMERRLRAESDSTPLVVLDARGTADHEEELDKAVRACASLALSLARAGGCAVLLPGDRRATALDPTLGGWAHLHARLALVAPGGGPSMSGVAGRSGLVVYVAARVPSRAPRALEHAPAAGRVLVVPGQMAGLRASFTVCGCTGYAVEPGRAGRRAA
ncbi:MAG TPA: DUF58 domain-containing protein [Solirubrobacteraceae bacterium]|nr:DUF58 domain-containing protein [Solirubrobacteraceae bacterium]